MEYGLADEIVDETKDLTEAKQLMQKSNRKLEQQISYSKALVALSKEVLELAKPLKEPKEPKEPKKPIENKNTISLFLSIFK